MLMSKVKNHFILVSAVAFTIMCGTDTMLSQEAKPDSVTTIPINYDSITIENNAYKVGEKLTFSVDYGPIQAGTAILSVPDTAVINGRTCYHIVSKALSSESFSIFFKVEDIIESFVDKQGLYSWRIKKHINEGRFHKDELYEFDYAANIAYSEEDTTAIFQIMQDALSALYYIRVQDLKIGMSINLSHFDNGKVHKLEVKVKKREKIKVKAGIFDTILVEPIMSGIGVFKHGGQIKVWLTNDKKKMPVRMTTKVYLGSIGLGSIGANLIKYEGTD